LPFLPRPLARCNSARRIDPVLLARLVPPRPAALARRSKQRMRVKHMSQHTILVVDDEPDVRMLLRLFFERQGHAVCWARDGEEAVEVARQRQPDLVVMDIQMPRKTGIEAVVELRADARFAATPMVALTAYARMFLPADVIRAGFDEVIFKPFDFGQVEAVVAGLMQK
jgi:CheY-like chemotaxis protein